MSPGTERPISNVRSSVSLGGKQTWPQRANAVIDPLQHMPASHVAVAKPSLTPSGMLIGAATMPRPEPLRRGHDAARRGVRASGTDIAVRPSRNPWRHDSALIEVRQRFA